MRGPEHYLYFRLMADPARTVGDIRQEYFSSFGPAAPHVERYFDYWEDYQYKLLEADNWGVWDRYAFGVGGVQVQYPPEVFVPAAKILDEALAAVAATELPECAERVKFLQAGLEHARLCARFVGTVDGGGRARHDPILPADTEAFGFKAAQQALHDLMSFRSQHQRPYIADYARTARLELRRLRTDVETLLSAMDAESGEADGVVP